MSLCAVLQLLVMLLLLPSQPLLQWLQFCTANPRGRKMPADVQVALADILNLAAA
jgi:hypothetical protein